MEIIKQRQPKAVAGAERARPFGNKRFYTGRVDVERVRELHHAAIHQQRDMRPRLAPKPVENVAMFTPPTPADVEAWLRA